MSPETASHIIKSALFVDGWLIIVVLICKCLAFCADAGEKIASGGTSNSEASR